MDCKTARSQLHELLQLISNAHGVSNIVPEVVYETITDPAPAQHVCHLSLQLPGQHEPLRFTTSDGKRKNAYEAAAALALAQLKDAVPQPQRTQHLELTDVLREMLLPGQGTKRNPEMMGHLAASIAAGQGAVVFLGIVLRCKAVKAWLAQHAVDDADPEASAAYLAKALVAQAPQIGEAAHMQVLHNGWALQLCPSHPLCAEPPHRRDAPPVTASAAVLLPADATVPMQEVPLDLSRPVLLETVAQLLGGNPWHVLVHGKVGRRGVQGLPSRHDGPQQPAEEAGQVAQPLERPFLYSLGAQDDTDTSDDGAAATSAAPHAVLNARASWIAGRRVHGPALLACAWVPNHGACGLQHHGPYTLSHALRHIGTLMPSSEWASSQPGWVGQLMTGLPAHYRAARVWQGPSPLQLLATYTTQRTQPQPQPTPPPPDALPTAAVWPGGPILQAAPVEVDESADDGGADDDGSADVAGRRAQEEALGLLRSLERAALRLFGAPVEASGVDEDARLGARPESGSATPGSLRQPVRMGDAVQLQLSPASAMVMGLQGSDHAPACLYMDAGCVSRSLQDSLLVARRGDMVRVTLDLPVALPLDPLTVALGVMPTTRRSLAVQVAKVSSAVGGPGNGGLFSPALSIQRYSLVGAIAAALGCKHVLDVGCGGGRLLTNLATAAVGGALPSVCTLTGCDISESAIRSASSAIARLKAAQPTAPVMQALLGDMLNPELPLPAPADFVCMVEVVEHLDPGPLSKVPDLLLRRLRPPVAVVTTPNCEYNPVLAARGGGLLANNMRNSDHRFEWTRKEFAMWAKRHAAKYGYQVRLMGVGRVTDEAATLDKLGLRDVGAASQVAIFTLEHGA